MQYRLQYCNEVHYVNSGYSWGAPPQLETWGGGGGRVAPPPRASYAYVSLSKQAKHAKLHSFYQKFKG